MRIIYYFLKKEVLIIIRDIHALGILFIMPMAFILIMSLAMQDLFQLHTKVKINLMLVNRDSGEKATRFLNRLQSLDMLSTFVLEQALTLDTLKQKMYQENYDFALVIEKHFSSSFDQEEAIQKGREPLILLVNPTVNQPACEILKISLISALGKLKLNELLENMGDYLLSYVGLDKTRITAPLDPFLQTIYVYKNKQRFEAPSAVQQSVPSWLVLSMYFVLIPLSNTFIMERNHGTMIRLKSMNLPSVYFLLGKIVPFFIINQIQFVLMVSVGLFLVPVLGGDALSLGNSYGGLLLISASVSFSAISLALLIASLAKTTEQATTIGGVLSLILAAIGGIMVPKFVMPEWMQTIAEFSPLSWGLEGFLDIFLRNGNFLDVLPESLLLFLWGMIMLIFTIRKLGVMT